VGRDIAALFLGLVRVLAALSQDIADWLAPLDPATAKRRLAIKSLGLVLVWIVPVISLFVAIAPLLHWHLHPPDYFLATKDPGPEKTRALLGESVVLSVHGLYRNQDPVNPDTLSCDWSYTPALPGLYQGHSCEAVSLRNSADYFSHSAAASLKLTINVAIQRGQQKPVVAGPLVITFLNQGRPDVAIARHVVALREKADLSFAFRDGQGILPAEHCHWSTSPPVQIENADACSATLIAPDDRWGDPETNIEVSITVFDADGKLASASEKVRVLRPPANFYVYVLDETGEMDNGKHPTMLDALKSEMPQRIKDLTPEKGWLGIITFGGPAPPEEACKRVNVPYPLDLSNEAKAQAVISAMASGGDQAPLLHALVQAKSAYADSKIRQAYDNVSRRDDGFFMIVVTGSTKFCDDDPAIQLHELRMQFGELNLYFDNRFLSAIIVAPSKDAVYSGYVDSYEYRKERNRTLILKANDSADMQALLTDFSRLSRRVPPQVRAQACGHLRAHLRPDDETARGILAPWCG
jgi:hypothetical protein